MNIEIKVKRKYDLPREKLMVGAPGQLVTAMAPAKCKLRGNEMDFPT